MFGQLLISQLILLVLLVITVPALVLVNLRTTADDYVAQRLHSDADILAHIIDISGRIDHATAVHALGPLYVPPWGSRGYRIVDANGRVIDQGGVDAAMPPTNQGAVASALDHVGKLDVYRSDTTIAGRPGHIIVAQDRTRPEVIVDDVVAGFLRRSLWIIPIILMASTAAGLLVVRRVTKQLRVASNEADRVAPSTLDVRLDPTALPLEARGLANATNAALDRVADGYRRQSQFVASVAHELRTPMALLMLRCDAMPDTPEREGLRAAIDQASHVVAQLMELATIEGRSPTIGPIDLSAVARDVVEASAPIVFRSGRSIEATTSTPLPLIARGNAGLLRIAVSNLVDNAMRHTPADTHITVSAAPGSVAVSDDGPGIRTSDREPGRFQSVGQGRSDSAGLGLSIVQRIMTAMHGAMDVREGGPGALVTLRLTAPS